MKAGSRLLWTLFPAAILLLWVGASAGEEKRGYAVCRHRNADGQAARPVDLAKVDAEYAKASRSFRERVKKAQARTIAFRDEGYESGVKGCVRDVDRTLTLEAPLPPSFRGRRLFFLRAPPAGRRPAGLGGPIGPGSIVFILAYARQEDVGRLAERLGANVSRGTAELAAEFGVRCATSVIDVAKDGKTLEIQEHAP